MHDHEKVLAYANDMAKNYDLIVFNGGLCQKNVGERISAMQEFLAGHKAIYIAGRIDYCSANEEASSWINQQCNVAMFEFQMRKLLVMDGGIPKTTQSKSQLFDNLELSFVSTIDAKPWHQSYNGRFGYVISNNLMTDDLPQYHTYSMQIGCKTDERTYAQEVDEIGLKQLFLIGA